MCHFITVITPVSADTQAIKKIAEKFSLGWKEFKNPFVCSQLNKKMNLFCTTKGTCNCGTLIGINSRANPEKIDIVKEKIKLKKKGWSDRKINQWIEQKIETVAEGRNLETEEEIQQWIGFITEVLKTDTTKVTTLGILLHYYSSKIETENFVLKETNIEKRCTASSLLNIKEDQVCFFIKEFGEM